MPITRAYEQASQPGNFFVAGKNKIINGAFDIWQRGTTTNLSASTVTYLADRFSAYMDSNAGTFTYSRQTFTPGTAPVAGYEGTYFARLTTGGNCNMAYQNWIEDVRTLAGQTVTLSFWGKASTAKTLSYAVLQNFGSGGSANVTAASGSFNYTTSWQRFSTTFTMPSVSGKTIGTGSYVLARMLDYQSVTGNFDVDIWGVQLEAGSVATAFQTATGTLAGELAACQRYFQILGGDNVYEYFGIGVSMSVTESNCVVPLKVTMRSAPTTTFTTASNYKIVEGVGAGVAATSVAGDILTKNTLAIQFQSTNNLNTYRANRMMSNNTTSATISISAEL